MKTENFVHVIPMIIVMNGDYFPIQNSSIGPVIEAHFVLCELRTKTL
jgi:hypothetical protein